VAEERRYPGKLTPLLCRQLSGRHVAVFKWRRKLKAGPSRPHPVPDKIVIADRLMSLLSWITENSGRKLEHLWEDLLPNEIGDEEKTGWYHDLHWLLNQGYVLLMADSTIHRSKRPGGDESKRPAERWHVGRARSLRQRARRKREPRPLPRPRRRSRSSPDRGRTDTRRGFMPWVAGSSADRSMRPPPSMPGVYGHVATGPAKTSRRVRVTGSCPFDRTETAHLSASPASQLTKTD